MFMKYLLFEILIYTRASSLMRRTSLFIVSGRCCNHTVGGGAGVCLAQVTCNQKVVADSKEPFTNIINMGRLILRSRLKRKVQSLIG